MTDHIVFLLEEPSARDLLEGLLPNILPDSIKRYFLVFEGKQDLERQLIRKIRGWILPNAAFVILRDQDAANCTMVKQKLVDLVEQTGRSVLVRIACRELESWFLGDWNAVSVAFGKPQLKAQANKATYRDPDILNLPVQELRKFIPDYQKRNGAKRLGRLLDPNVNKSKSFLVFCSGVRSLVPNSALCCEQTER